MMDKRVLLVEPDPDRCCLYRGALRRAGYAVVEARTGEEAIWTVCRERPCAVVMECSTPGVSGLRATEVLKAEPRLRAIPVLLLSSAGDSQEARDAYRAECDSYVAEPESPEAVLAALRRLTARDEREAGAGSSPAAFAGAGA